MHKFFVNKENISSIQEFCENMPGGFFIYKKDDEQIIYANKSLLNIYKCKDLLEFKEITGNTFSGMVHPDDLIETKNSINNQIKEKDGYDSVSFRIICYDKSIRHLVDYGHLINSSDFGDIFYVFVSDDTKKWQETLKENNTNSILTDVLNHTTIQYKEIYVIDLINDYHYQVYPKTKFEGKYMETLINHKHNLSLINDNIDDIISFLSLDNIINELKYKNKISIRYKRFYSDTSTNEFSMVNFLIKEKVNDKPTIAILTIQNIEEIVKTENEYKRSLELVNALASDYDTILLADDSNDSIETLRIPDRLKFYVSKSYKETKDALIYSCVHTDDIERLKLVLESNNIVEARNNNTSITTSIRVYRKERYIWAQVKVVPLGGDNTSFIVGIKDVDSEVRRTLEDNTILKKALEDAEKANVAKTKFLRDISHDMRTPMNAIMGYNSLIKYHLNEPDSINTFSNKIQTASEYLLKLINDVLDIRKIEAEDKNISKTKIELTALLQSIKGILSPLALEKNMNIILNINIKNDIVYSDKTKITQIIVNCISNSIKYSNEGDIIVDLNESILDNNTSIYNFSITDYGIGMSEEFIKQIYEPFSREKNTTVSGIQGAGLGMTITKKIIDNLNGSIRIISKVGFGTSVKISLPLLIEN